MVAMGGVLDSLGSTDFLSQMGMDQQALVGRKGIMVKIKKDSLLPVCWKRASFLGERGFTLVELMIGLVVAMVVVGAGYTIMTSTEKASTVNDQTAQMQQNARIAMELVSRDIQLAGFGFNGAVGDCTNALMPLDNNPAGADTGPDSLRVVVPTTLGTLNGPASGPTTTLALTAGSIAPFAPDFAVNAIVSVNGAASATVSAISGDTLTLANPGIIGPALFPAGATVYWLRCMTYAIGTTNTKCSGNAPCLLRGVRNIAVADVNNDPGMVPLAEGVEDLQFAYACDGCTATTAGIDDGIVDDQNGTNTFDRDDFISNNTWLGTTVTPPTIRLVRINIVARQNRSDPDWRSTGLVVVEDHNPSSDAGYNGQTYSSIRRRLFTRTVQVRNLGL
jgi:type IV pilus assembly protein PilW